MPKHRDIPPGIIMRPGLTTHSIKTVAVIGVARGGTSFIAECLIQLGVDMGSAFGNGRPGDSSVGPADYCNYEDAEIAIAIEEIIARGKADDASSNEWRYLKQLIQDRDVMKPLWGFKRPQAVFIIDYILPLLRNPHIILVMRDPIAIWSGQKARNKNGKATWGMARHSLGCVMDLAEKPRGPTLALSFERAKAEPNLTRNLIASFLGLVPLESDICAS